MIDLHAEVYEDPDRLADWIELETLSSSVGSLSRADILDVVKDSGVAFFEDDPYEEDEDYAEVLIELAWARLEERAAAAASSSYPFKILKSRIDRRQSSWQDFPAFTLMLICDVGRFYDSVQTDFTPGDVLPDLFERIVEAAQKGLFGGVSSWFPSCSTDVWPKQVKKRAERLATLFGLQTLSLGNMLEDDDDAGLDVATRLRLHDELPGTLVVLTQCATGANWRGKKGEPALTEWSKYIDWSSPLLRAIAVPWRLAPGAPRLERGVTNRRAALARYCARFDGAMILDRPRLAAGRPDAFLDDSCSAQSISWCSERLCEFPKV